MERVNTTTQAQLEIVSPAGELRFYPLTAGGVIRLGQRPENDLVLDSPSVAPFHLILDHRHTSYRLLLLSEAAETRFNGQPLRPHTAIELRHLDIIELGGYSVILLTPEPDMATPKANSIVLRSTAFSDFIEPISVNLSAHHWTVNLEQPATCQVILTNNTVGKVTGIVSITGVDESWLTLAPVPTELKPGEQREVTIAITPPWLPTSSAGPHSLTVIVTSPNHAGWCNQQKAILTINPYYEFAVGELTPKRQTLARFQQTGQTLFTLTNKSNCSTLFKLTGADEAEVCYFEFQPPNETVSLATAAELRLLPGQTATIPVRIIPPPCPFIKLSRQVYTYTLTATLLDGRQTSRSVLGQMISTPMIGPWLISLSIFCLIALIALILQAIIEQTWDRPIEVSQATPVSFPTASYRPAMPTPNIPPTAIPELTYQEIFQKIAPQYGLDWRILAELAYRESHMNPLAVGRDNDMGLMQILPSTWNEWAPKVGASNPFDPYSNALVAAAYLAYLRDYCQARGYPETQWMLIGYNWGPQNLRQLFERQGGLAEVPEAQRQYAFVIIQAASGVAVQWEKLVQKTVDTSLKY